MPSKRCLSEQSGRLFSSALCGTIAAFPFNRNAALLFHFLGYAAVGYQNINAGYGFTMLTPSFAGIGGDYSIQNIKISGDNVYGMGGEQIQVVDSEGSICETFTWYIAGYFGVEEGWYDEGYGFADRNFEPGEAALVYNDAGDYTITFSGEVNYTAIPAYPGDYGFISLGNMTPVSKGIQKYTLAGDNVYGMGGEQIQVVDSEGSIVETYTWYIAGYFGVEEGWYDEGYGFADKEFDPASGFLVYNDAGEYTISVPGTND